LKGHARDCAQRFAKEVDRMKRLLTTTALLTLLAAAPAWAQSTTPSPRTNDTGVVATQAQLSKQDQDFVNDAAIGGKAEVELGKLAQKQSKNQAVKDLGKHMEDDHSKANDKLAAVAKDLKLTLPRDLDKKHKDTSDRLAKLSGDQFDREYVSEMLKDHQEDIAKFQKEIDSGQNSQIKSFASTTLPTLQQHLKMVQDTQAKLGNAVPQTSSAPGTSQSGSSGARPSGSGAR
jgi:putative membrane protein